MFGQQSNDIPVVNFLGWSILFIDGQVCHNSCRGNGSYCLHWKDPGTCLVSSQPLSLTHTLGPLGMLGESLGTVATVAPQLVLAAKLAAMGSVTFIYI